MKSDLLLAAHVKAVGTFSVQTENKNKIKTMGVPVEKKAEKKSPYGNLFSDK